VQPRPIEWSERVTTPAQTDVPFKLMVRPFTTVGVDTRYPFTLFEDELIGLTAGHVFGSPVRRVVVTPAIIDPTVAVPPKDYSKFNRKEGSVFVGNKIDYKIWESSSQDRKLEIFAESIKSSILTISPKYITPADCVTLTQAIERILHIAKARLLN